DERAGERARRGGGVGAAHRRQRGDGGRSLVGGAVVVDAACAVGFGGVVGALGRRAAVGGRAVGGAARGARRRRWIPLARAVPRRRLRAGAAAARRGPRHGDVVGAGALHRQRAQRQGRGAPLCALVAGGAAAAAGAVLDLRALARLYAARVRAGAGAGGGACRARRDRDDG